MNSSQRKRLKWVQLYEHCGDAGKVCMKCGISRPTLRKCLKRYGDHGIVGLLDQSRKPHHSPKVKVTDTVKKLILSYREQRKLGARRLQVNCGEMSKFDFLWPLYTKY